MTTTPALDWTDIDEQAVNVARALALDAVQKVGNGHPGTAVSLAPVAYLLFQKKMRHNPVDTQWSGRDRFVLSIGHSSMTLYAQLFLGGFGLEIDDLQALRTWGSKTPGHPEYHHTLGVETTTGPLGQGVGNAVGMAMAQRRERALLDPDAPEGESVFDHHIYALCGDGDLQEGVAAEAASLAGHHGLGNLTMIYDANRISIEGDTNISFTEDVAKRFQAYGWDVQTVKWTKNPTQGDKYVEDVPALWEALHRAEQVTDKPSLIVLHTIIGWPCPTKQNTYSAHGSALGADEVAATKELLGLDPAKDFQVPRDVLRHTRGLKARGKDWHKEWNAAYRAWRKEHKEAAAIHDRMAARSLPEGLRAKFPAFKPDPKGMATRAASGKVLNAIAAHMPELWGGSADLAGSNNTSLEGIASFTPTRWQTDQWQGDPDGRVLHFGIREHAMGSLMNGMTLHGGTRVYGGTFLVFSDYMRPAVRLAALMGLPVVYVWTHDSIGVGEDGPTHQPVEHLAALRAIPGLDVVRPGDAAETSVCWRAVLEHNDRPAALALTRQNIPMWPHGSEGYASANGAAKGAYTLLDTDGTPDVILIGTGSEVQLAVEARVALAKKGIAARVVSMPCREWFDAQPRSYRDKVLPPAVRARVSVEAGVGQGWRDIVGDAGRIVSLEHFGASADQAVLFEQFGITSTAVVKAAQDSLKEVK